jgi:1-deoxy-D-xylulose-5-phosphate synthase
MVQPALKTADILENEGITCEVVNMRFVKPLDGPLIDSVAARFKFIVTLEDNVVSGGFGSAVAEYLAAQGITDTRLKIHGVPDRFVEQGTPAELQRDLMLDPPGITTIVRDFLAAHHPEQRRPMEAIAE